MTAGYLLDTHVVLWWLAEPARLSQQAREVIADGAQLVLVSAAAAWEMAIKRRLGRLSFPDNLEDVLRAGHIDLLPITVRHALAVADLPLLHQDPFDRILIAQARLDDLVLITRDPRIAAYDVATLLA